MKKTEYKDLQLITDEGKSWLYNPTNDRMIMATQPLEEYLPTIEDRDNPLNQFYTSKKQKQSLANIHLLSMTCNSNKAFYLKKVIYFLLNDYVSLVSLVVALVCTSLLLNNLIKVGSTLKIYEIISLYLVFCFIIIPLHEYSHFVVYDRFFNFSKVKFGFAIRYLSLLVFFTKVPFYQLLTPSQKKTTALAGIKMQVFIWAILALFCMLYPNHFILIILITNIGMIVINSIPFLKLDGYWYLSSILHTTDYMEEFGKMLLGKSKKRFTILLIGFVNSCFIGLSFLWVVVKLMNLFH